MFDASKNFGSWLNASMQTRGLSQAALARQVGVADAQVSRWRRGQVTPSVRYLQRIAETFDVPRATLEQLAGYSWAESDAAAGELDPEREAELQALLARFRSVLEDRLPRDLWLAYGDVCEALADQLAGSFDGAIAQARRKSGRTIGFHVKD